MQLAAPDDPEPEPSGLTWQESLGQHISNLQYMAKHVDTGQADELVRLVRSCRGLVIFTGVGQSSLLASKVAATYASLSLRSVSVDAVALLHGNLGMLRPQDLLILLSNSGETVELRRLMEACQALGHTNTVAVHAAPDCTLEKRATYAVRLPLLGEADHLGIVPTASSSCFLSFLQAVAAQVACADDLTAEAFVRTHPGGTLGGSRWEDE